MILRLFLLLAVMFTFAMPVQAAPTPELSVLVVIPMVYDTPEGYHVEMDGESFATAAKTAAQLPQALATLTRDATKIRVDTVQMTNSVTPDLYRDWSGGGTVVSSMAIRDIAGGSDYDITVVITDPDAVSATQYDARGLVFTDDYFSAWAAAYGDLTLGTVLHEMAHDIELQLRMYGYDAFPQCEETLGAGIHCEEFYGYANDIDMGWLTFFYNTITPEMWQFI